MTASDHRVSSAPTMEMLRTPAATDDGRRLVDLGERRLIAEILTPRYKEHGYRFGDDCAVLQRPENAGEFLIATTDPCPEPLPAHFGFTDLYYWGWLLATINLSDLAAAGAVPHGLLTSLVMPNDTSVADFVRLLDGIDECAYEQGTQVIGGNLKEGPELDLVATAIGSTMQPPLSRRGASPGDLLGIIGGFGTYWAGVLARMSDAVLPRGELERLEQAMLRPRPMLAAGQAMQKLGVVTSCLDNSDGLYASVTSLSRANDVGFHLDIGESLFDETVLTVARSADVDPFRLVLAFGDWNLLCCFPPAAADAVSDAVRGSGSELRIIGEANDSQTVTLTRGARTGVFRAVDSERFRSTSMFTAGIDQFIESVLHGPVWDE